jgi:hypothetical protein
VPALFKLPSGVKAGVEVGLELQAASQMTANKTHKN